MLPAPLGSNILAVPDSICANTKQAHGKGWEPGGQGGFQGEGVARGWLSRMHEIGAGENGRGKARRRRLCSMGQR